VSTTNHGPANHDDDLRRALRDLVDDASLSGPVAHLDVIRGRTRRRRAAKKAALGATTLCVAGALGVAALSLPQGPRVEPVAPAQSPSATAAPVVEPLSGAFAPVCGEDLSDLQATTTPLTLTPSGARQAPLDLANTGDEPLTLPPTGRVAIHLLDTDGTVVSTVGVDESAAGAPADEPVSGEPVTLDPGGAHRLTLADVGPCDDAGLPPAGTHTAIALLTVDLTTDGQDAVPSTVVGGPWIVTTDAQGRITGLAGRAVEPPVAETPTAPDTPESPAVPADPVEVRDVLEVDTSAVFDALRDAATSGAPAVVDLFYSIRSEWDLVQVARGPDSRRLTVSDLPGDLGRPRATSDDGWAMSVHGGAFFTDELPDTGLNSSQAFERLLGTFDVTLDESGSVPTFVLQVVDGGTPATAPPTTDRETCRAFDENRRTSDVPWPRMDADLDALAAFPGPAAESPRYPEIRARWIDSPRFWWAMQGYYHALRAGEPTGDAIVVACIGHWDGYQ
jgi:hypothetical protein